MLPGLLTRVLAPFAWRVADRCYPATAVSRALFGVQIDLHAFEVVTVAIFVIELEYGKAISTRGGKGTRGAQERQLVMTPVKYGLTSDTNFHHNSRRTLSYSMILFYLSIEM